MHTGNHSQPVKKLIVALYGSSQHLSTSPEEVTSPTEMPQDGWEDARNRTASQGLQQELEP